MTTPPSDDTPRTLDDRPQPFILDKSATDSFVLDQLVSESVSDKPAARRTPSPAATVAVAGAGISSAPSTAISRAVAAAELAVPASVTKRLRAAWASTGTVGQRPGASSVVIAILLLSVIGEAAAIVMLLRRSNTTAGAGSGSVAIATVPPGARVIVEDTDRGATPLTLTLPAGTHRAVLALGGERREIAVNVTGGGTHAHHLEFAPRAAVSGTNGANGAVEVRSRPSGASVIIAGAVRGRTPLTVADLSPGVHDVLLRLDRQELKDSIKVTSGSTAQLFAAFPATSTRSAHGWIAIASPVELTILEKGQVLGTTRSPRIMVPAGRHALELVNERLGYRGARVLDVDDGKTVSFTPDLPNGTASVNALPWAEVWIQDRKIGDTPLANLSLPIGTHSLVFRHPALGERRQDVTITAGTPARVSVDMRK